jgi:hypothetical protein
MDLQLRTDDVACLAYFARINTAMVTRAMLLNKTLWPHRAINPIIFNLQSINSDSARCITAGRAHYYGRNDLLP